MDAEEAKEKLKDITKIKDEDALYDLINKCYHALPAAIRHKRIDDDFEVTVLDEIFIKGGKTDNGLSIIPESIMKQINSMVDESKETYGEKDAELEVQESQAESNEDSSESAVDLNILGEINNALGKDGATTDQSKQKEKKDVIFFTFCGAEGTDPIGMNYNDRLIIFKDKKSIPNELIGKTIKRKGITVEIKEDKTCEISVVIK